MVHSLQNLRDNSTVENLKDQRRKMKKKTTTLHYDPVMEKAFVFINLDADKKHPPTPHPRWCNYCPLFKWSENETETLKTSKPMCCNSGWACPSSALLSLPLRNEEMHSALYRIALPERFRSSRRRDGGERKLCGCTLTVPRKASSRDRHFYESLPGRKQLTGTQTLLESCLCFGLTSPALLRRGCHESDNKELKQWRTMNHGSSSIQEAQPP